MCMYLGLYISLLQMLPNRLLRDLKSADSLLFKRKPKKWPKLRFVPESRSPNKPVARFLGSCLYWTYSVIYCNFLCVYCNLVNIIIIFSQDGSKFGPPDWNISTCFTWDVKGRLVQTFIIPGGLTLKKDLILRDVTTTVSFIFLVLSEINPKTTVLVARHNEL